MLLILNIGDNQTMLEKYWENIIHYYSSQVNTSTSDHLRGLMKNQESLTWIAKFCLFSHHFQWLYKHPH